MTDPTQPPHHCPACTCPTRQTGSAWLYSEQENGRNPHHPTDHDWIRTMPTVPSPAPALLAIGIACAALCLSALTMAAILLT